MATINTKWFTSAMAGAPSIVGNIGGGMIAVLDACLKDGFNLLTLDSLVVAANVATGTKASHGYIVNQVVLISGATPAGLNGEWRVTSVTSSTFTFATSGISDQTATGTITAKASPCGWEKQFSGTNLAVYRSGNVLSSRQCVRVDDTVAQYSTVIGAESFTDVATPVNSFATHYFKRSNATDATTRPWLIVADDKGVYIGVQWTNAGIYDFYHFGDFNSVVAGDAANFRLQGLTSSGPGTIGQYSSVCDSGTENALYPGSCSRSYAQIFGATTLCQGSMAAISGVISTSNVAWSLSGNRGEGTTQNTPAYFTPAISDNGYHFSNVVLIETSGGSRLLRGTVRGLLHVLEYLPQSSGYSILSGVENVSGGLVLISRSAGSILYASGAYFYPSSTVAFSLGDWT